MKRIGLLGAALGAAALCGCAASPKSLSGLLSGRVIRSVDGQGNAYVHYLAADGTVHTRADSRALTGRWVVRDQELCFRWSVNPAPPEDCWRFDRPPATGATVTARNRQGRWVSATLL